MKENKLNLSILDACMGEGKSSWAIEKLKNKSPEENYILVTPYLTEIKRFIDELDDFHEPKHLGEGKLDNLHELLTEEKNIVASHSLFRMCNSESVELIKDGSYSIIIDEALDVFEIFDISRKDLEMLEDYGIIEFNDKNKIVWKDLEYYGEFDLFKRMCVNGQVYKIKEMSKKIMLSWTFDFEVIKSFKEITVMTYIYEAQLMYYYFLLNGVTEYNKYTLEDYKLVEYYYKSPNVKDKVNIYEGSMNKLGEKQTALSLSWFKNNSALVEKLKKHILSYFRTTLNVKSNELIWTTFKSKKNALKGLGYTNGFISLNTRATNEYGDRKAIAYCCNRYISPDYVNFLKDHDISFNQEAYALSELVQFIWRSRIRNSEEIFIFIPSNRMRHILKDWLDS